MIRVLMAFVSVLLCSASVHAQEEVRPDQLHRMYDDALSQLRAAQERRNELANENRNLQARIDELEQQLAAARTALVEQSRSTYEIRSTQAAWNAFMDQYPQLKRQWRFFIERASLLAPAEPQPVIDRDWPLSTAG